MSRMTMTVPSVAARHRFSLARWGKAGLVAPALVGGITLSGCAGVGEAIDDLSSALSPTTPRQAAEQALDQYDPDRRRQGILLLSNSAFGGTEVYLNLYREYTTSETDPMVRAVAIQALARFGESEDALLIQSHLSDENRHVRWEAAKGLQRLHNPEVVPALLATIFLVDETVDVRAAAATALGQYPQDNVFQGLVAALNASELSINLAASDSLAILTGKNLGPKPRDWLRWYAEASREGDAFREGTDYLFPTYTRQLTFFENLIPWSKPTFESPAPPAGLRSSGERSTYQEEDVDQSGSPPDGGVRGR